MTGQSSTRGKITAAAMALAVTLSACTTFPELDAAQTPGVENAAFPKLVPLDGLLTGPEPRATVEMAQGIEGRIAGLQARASRLRRLSAAPRGVGSRLARLRQKAAALRAMQ
ncbi:hypothetical protein [Pacificoceanicola onchidii]|uniref:hypothetical protein n=1 Tax=Pacificoceanicola onchidii TaxID=2562685 RepID=UPI0019822C7A|nr:hypothetical protein [Pacificoceanicola onchidii]